MFERDGSTFELIIIDLNEYPEESLEAAHQIRKYLRSRSLGSEGTTLLRPFICLLTAFHKSGQWQEQAFAKGIDDVIQKPVFW